MADFALDVEETTTVPSGSPKRHENDCEDLGSPKRRSYNQRELKFTKTTRKKTLFLLEKGPLKLSLSINRQKKRKKEKSTSTIFGLQRPKYQERFSK